MWVKSIPAIFGGCLVSVSIMLNLNYLLPTAVDTRLFIGLLCAFPLWVTMMVWCYVSDGGKQAWKRCGSVLLLSVCLNAIFVLR